MFRFACTQCGKCCNFTATADLYLGITELPQFADRFLIQGLFNFANPPGTEGEIIGRENGINEPEIISAISAAVAEQTEVLTFPAPPYSVAVHAHIAVIPAPGGACSALVDKKCSMYEDRPFFCRTYPLPVNLPLAASSRVIGKMVEPECDVSEGSPVFLENETLANPEYVALWEQAPANRLWRKRLAQNLLGMPGIGGSLPDMINSYMRGGPRIFVDALPFINAAINFGVITESSARIIVEQQIKLAEARVANAAKLKLSSERQMTVRLRQFIENYKQALANWGDARRRYSSVVAC